MAAQDKLLLNCLRKLKYLIYIIAFTLISNNNGVFVGHAATNPTLLLYSTSRDIRILNMTRNNHNKITSTVLIKNFTEGPIINFHYEQKKICWADHVMERIQCADYNGTETRNQVEVISDGISPVGLACDWFTNKLYWTDSETKRVEVTTMDGLYRKVLFWTDIDQPRAITLAPMKGLMFWTDWGEIPKIERAGMNGDPNTRKIIVANERIFWPNSLVIDFQTELIYWIDGKLNFIESMTYDGENRTIILKDKFDYPFALTMFHSKLFWTDWKTWSIHGFDKSTNEVKEIYHHGESFPVDIHAFHEQRQPKFSHPCERNNGGCSHLCLLSPNRPGYSCACPSGIKLIDNDTTTCADGPQELLLLSRRTDICLIYLDSPEYTYKVLPLLDLKFTIGVDYDPIEKNIYWSDDDVKKIRRAKLNGDDQEDVIVSDIQHPDGVGIDWIARNVYWVDAGRDMVEVVRLTSPQFRKVVIGDDLDEPRAIAVAPELGWLFWSDWSAQHPKVERANLDGSERVVVVGKDVGWPNGITLDLINMKMYWCDARIDKIEYSDMDGNDRRVLISEEVPHIFGLTIMGNYLYWTDWQLRTIQRAHKLTGRQRETVIEQMPNVMGLKAIKLRPVTGGNLCSIDNGRCSQLCFYRHNKTRICACQLGFELAKNRRTCIEPETFLLYTTNNRIGRIGVENEDNEAILPIRNIHHASAIDYDMNTMRIYWSDSNLRTITRAFMNGSDPQTIVDLGLVAPAGMAVDWLSLNIYWTDSQAHRIEVARLVGSSRRTLLWEEKVHDPHSIALDPTAGYMYWSEWGSSKSIKKAALDGSKIRNIRSTKGFASDLTLDCEKRRLYWIEINSSAILSSDFNGNDKRTIVTNDLFKPIGLTLHQQFIYWSEDSTGEIMKADKFDGSNRQRIYRLSNNITDLLIYHNRQVSANQCAVSNGGCSHLCLTLPPVVPEGPLGYTCACPTHFTRVGTDCIPPKEFMIYSQKNLTVRLYPNPSECLESVLQIQGLKSVKAIEFDPVHNFLYWIEGKTHSIKRVESNGSQVSVVLHGTNELQPFDLALDSIGRLLFWSCSMKNVVNITRLDNSLPFGVVIQRKDEKPRLLAIHSTKRLLFYTDVGPDRQLIRTRLDGSHRLVITKNADIAAIAVDLENDWIVWAQDHGIHASNIEGENQHAIMNENQSKITHLAVLSGWLYWIDRESSELQRVDLQSGKSTSSLSLQASHIVDIISIGRMDYQQNHSCNFQTTPMAKRCSHLCIFNGTIPMCACPIGNELKDDKRTCRTLVNCGDDRFTCALNPSDDNKDCIPMSWRCDRQKDCFDGSDEFDCPACDNNQFKCLNGNCINAANVCDGIAHCLDQSDEENCCKDGFQCPNTHVCLPLSLVCDNVDQCADGSDEHPSICNNVSAKLKGTSEGMLVLIIIGILAVSIVIVAVFYCFVKRLKVSGQMLNDQSEDSLSPMNPKPLLMMNQFRKGIPDVVRMSMLPGSGDSTSSYDRNHITGASSSTMTNGSSLTMCYPRETLNPPPSPATTAASTRGSSPSSRYNKHYRHHKAKYKGPPPTPCSTDVCDESDYNYSTVRCRYEGGQYPPPPTPRSHCHSESCPPSPSSRSSTYFHPFPPPPSPVASPPMKEYDS